ncbi:protein ImuB [Pseudoxanthobacter soli DSM 19599]|uniref:Protein ImuB n=2 Tax=Pseudoxanthobacter TaxID=433838 RepID=A0A1M7ZR07_9HYPH|nr:protein ImuB [Pseudoxanthobacter soli DSM 19599]
MRAGLRAGIPATRARIMVPGLAVEDADPGGDAEALERLAVWMQQRYAPVVAVDPPDGIVIETSGADHLHGGEAAMLADIVDRLAASGIAARAAIADSWGAAHGLARYGQGRQDIARHDIARQDIARQDIARQDAPQDLTRPDQTQRQGSSRSGSMRRGPAQPVRPTYVSLPGQAGADIAALPLAALRLAAGTAAGLRLLGFRSVADVEAAPRAPLALRFGPEPGLRLDQAFGRIAEPIDPLRPPDPVEVRRAFAEPISSAETIARHIGLIAGRLCEVLEARGLGARRLDLLCHRVDGTLQAVRVGTALPVRDVRHLGRLLCDRIETIAPGFGIEAMTLAVPMAEPLANRQAAASFSGEAAADISDLVDTLANRVGEHRLYRAAPVASDLPERSVGRVPPLAPETGATWTDPWPRPTRLLARPEPIETLTVLPDHPPSFFVWRGERQRVKRADGPERIFGEWWVREEETTMVRDYFRVEAESGERYWIFRAGNGEDPATGSHRWFLHGLFG